MPAMNDQNRCQSGISQAMVCGAGRCAFVRTASTIAHLRRPEMRRKGRESLLDFDVFAPSIFNARFTMTGANVWAIVLDHEWKSRRPSNGATAERRAHDAGGDHGVGESASPRRRHSVGRGSRRRQAASGDDRSAVGSCLRDFVQVIGFNRTLDIWTRFDRPCGATARLVSGARDLVESEIATSALSTQRDGRARRAAIPTAPGLRHGASPSATALRRSPAAAPIVLSSFRFSRHCSGNCHGHNMFRPNKTHVRHHDLGTAA